MIIAKSPLIFNLIIFFVFVFSPSRLSTLNETEIEAFSNNFRSLVSEKIKNDEDFKQLRQFKKIIPIPVCYVNPEDYFPNEKMMLAPALNIDSSASYCIIQGHNGNIIGTVHNYRQLSYSLGELNASNLWEAKMVDLVLKRYSTNLFIISLSDLDTNRVVGFFNSDDLNFINRKAELVTSSKELIIQQNGSIRKFNENLERQRAQVAGLNMIKTPEAARKFLNNDYLRHSMIPQHDTTHVISLLLNELKIVPGITEKQLELIQKQIRSHLDRKHLLPFCGTGLPFYTFDISPVIKAILTHEQYVKFVEQREIKTWLLGKASDIVYKHLIGKGVPSDEIHLEMNKYISETE